MFLLYMKTQLLPLRIETLCIKALKNIKTSLSTVIDFGGSCQRDLNILPKRSHYYSQLKCKSFRGYQYLFFTQCNILGVFSQTFLVGGDEYVILFWFFLTFFFNFVRGGELGIKVCPIDQDLLISFCCPSS